jgi:hypothetical protein
VPDKNIIPAKSLFKILKCWRMKEVASTGQQDKSKSVSVAKLRPFDLALDHDQLLAQECIFCEKVCVASYQV